MIPEVRLFWDIREWCLDLRRLHGGPHELTGYPLRGGWHFCFGPLSLFWVKEW